jgi:hypothetical protein
MGSIERRIRQLEDRYHAGGAGEEPGGNEGQEKRRRDFLESVMNSSHF